MSGQRRVFGLLGLAAMLAAGSAQAEDGTFIRDGLSTLGLIEPERPAITYRERAPLAMPPKFDPNNLTAGLPKPQTREDSPQWPKDPEVRQRERAAIEAKKPIVRGAQGRMSDNNETLSVYEMQGGRRAGAEVPDGPVIRPGDNTRESTWVNPLELLAGKSEPAEPSAVEPDRGLLTDPPKGYRKAPVKVARPKGEPVGGPISDNAEADPRAYMRSQAGR